MDNKMAVMPVGKLMLKMGLPIIISMMLQALDNNDASGARQGLIFADYIALAPACACSACRVAVLGLCKRRFKQRMANLADLPGCGAYHRGGCGFANEACIQKDRQNSVVYISPLFLYNSIKRTENLL